MKSFVPADRELLEAKVLQLVKQSLFLHKNQKSILAKTLSEFSEIKLLGLYKELKFSEDKQQDLIHESVSFDASVHDRIKNLKTTEIEKKVLRTTVASKSKHKK